MTIYRAVPDDLTVTDRIAKLERQKAYILRHGRVPPEVETNLNASRYYDRIHDELERLRAQAPTEEARAAINPGDWVTINRAYAKEHGESALRGNYRIISKRVRAKELFTNGDSIHEWGFWPEGTGFSGVSLLGPLAGAIAGGSAAGVKAYDATRKRP